MITSSANSTKMRRGLRTRHGCSVVTVRDPLIRRDCGLEQSEPKSNAGFLFFVPVRGRLEFRLGRWLDADSPAHFERRRSAIRL